MVNLLGLDDVTKQVKEHAVDILTTEDVEEMIADAIDTAILERLHPVGSIVKNTVDNTNPGERLGGTWTAIENRFLFALGTGYTIGATGGSVNTTLTIDNIPSHKHDVSVTDAGATNTGTKTGLTTATDGETTTGTPSTNSTNTVSNHQHPIEYSQDATVGGSSARTRDGGGAGTTNTEPAGGHAHNLSNHTHAQVAHPHAVNDHNHTISAHGHTVTESNKGSGESFSNMPPYLVVYMWERTA